MDNCIFCQIIQKRIPSHVIYEDTQYLAFLDVFPKAEGHILVIPKRHYRWVWDVDDIAGYFQVVQKIANHLKKKSEHECVMSAIFGNQVPHAHVHLIPSLNSEDSEKLSHAFETLSKGSLATAQALELKSKLQY